MRRMAYVTSTIGEGSSMNHSTRNCYNCLHTKVCHMRIELAKQVNRFKYLAATPEEVKNTNAERPVEALNIVVAQTCTEFVVEAKK